MFTASDLVISHGNIVLSRCLWKVFTETIWLLVASGSIWWFLLLWSMLLVLFTEARRMNFIAVEMMHSVESWWLVLEVLDWFFLACTYYILPQRLAFSSWFVSTCHSILLLLHWFLNWIVYMMICERMEVGTCCWLIPSFLTWYFDELWSLVL